MNNPRIVCSGPIDEVATKILKSFGEIVIAPNPKEETLLSLLDGTIGLVLRGEGSASDRLIHAAKDLKVIGRSGVGYDTVDIATATAHGIPVVFTPGANARAVAEAALTLMLVLSKKVFYWDQQLKQGNWPSRFETQPGDLDSATLGIIGFGQIGQMLAKLVASFNMTILAHDPYTSTEQAHQLSTELVELDVLLQRSDFISLNTALTDQTRSIINQKSLQQIKQGAYLINTARGGLIESLDLLYNALTEGKLAGVGLDVFEPEPPDVSHPLLQHPCCITSPHALALTPRAMGRIFESMATDMAAVLKGNKPRHVVNPKVFEQTKTPTTHPL